MARLRTGRCANRATGWVGNCPATLGVAGVDISVSESGTAATFFLACLAAMELEGVVLDEI